MVGLGCGVAVSSSGETGGGGQEESVPSATEPLTGQFESVSGAGVGVNPHRDPGDRPAGCRSPPQNNRPFKSVWEQIKGGSDIQWERLLSGGAAALAKEIWRQAGGCMDDKRTTKEGEILREILSPQRQDGRSHSASPSPPVIQD